jgi:hypothetical protein
MCFWRGKSTPAIRAINPYASNKLCGFLASSCQLWQITV